MTPENATFTHVNVTGNKLCVNLLRYAAQVYTICYPSSDVYTSIN